MVDPIPTGPQIITYADRLGGDVAGVRALLEGPLSGAFDGIHLLPFYLPYDGVDAGFDPQDHTVIDPRLGTWAEMSRLAQGRLVMADVIVNHMSTRSRQFSDVLANGDRSPWSGMFLTLSSVFPDGATEDDLTRIYRPRPGLPFTAMTLGGRRRLVWTTFTPEQVDLDVRSPQTWDYLTTVIDTLTAAGIGMLRLDALGYAGKEAGTNCFMTASTRELTERIVRYAHSRGAQALVEVHGHYQQQIDIAKTVDYVYDFALPPLVLHALTAADLEPLAHWLRIRPRNTVTVLDTHDGIGIVDVGVSDLRPGEPGLLAPDQIDVLVERIHANSGGTSRAATGAAASNLDLYQVNCTLYDALGRDDRRHVLARLLQLFVPGIPQVYYVGLLAGENDVALLAATGVGRDVNRHHYTPEQAQAALARPVVSATLTALRLRRDHPAFTGTFSYEMRGSAGEMHWRRGADEASLTFDAADGGFEVTATVEGASRTVLSSASIPR
ncbi:MAG TPA: sucrose phosphorylase [Propionicimonas sp.]